MSVNWTIKQQAWLTRFQALCVQLMADADIGTELCNEYADEQYGTGGTNAIADATVQGIAGLSSQTATTVASAEGVFAGANQILATIANVRGYLENMRP
jgi:hypothetical protein